MNNKFTTIKLKLDVLIIVFKNMHKLLKQLLGLRKRIHSPHYIIIDFFQKKKMKKTELFVFSFPTAAINLKKLNQRNFQKKLNSNFQKKV